MGSIQRKLTRLFILGIVLLTAFLLIINSLFITEDSGNSVNTILNRTCDAQGVRLDGQLRLIEQAVRDIYMMSEETRPDMDALRDPQTAETFIDNLEKSAVAIAEQTECAVAVYYRLNPELMGSGSFGFFSVLNPETNRIERQPATDILAYDEADVEHVGWYYEPVHAEKTIWMDPYFNQNINVRMISYVVPVYSEEQLVGVIGMDVDFDAILELASDIDIYPSAGVSLFCMNNRKSYQNRGNFFGDRIPESLFGAVASEKTSDILIDYTRNSMSYKISYYTLRNDMKYVVYVPTDDIYKKRNGLILAGSLLGTLFAAALAFAVVGITKSMLRPIKDITETTKQYAAGNWDAHVECHSRDELQVLTESINIMAENTKRQMATINRIAYRDALTGIRNRTAYTQYVKEFQKMLEEKPKDYAVMIFDLNFLKRTNDMYGHEAGDRLICAAAQIICRRFKHSPVFRLGGDEFAAVIHEGDYPRCHQLVEDFQKDMQKGYILYEGMQVSIACGVAFSEEIHPEQEMTAEQIYDAVFQCADDRMYENKADLKTV